MAGKRDGAALTLSRRALLAAAAGAPFALAEAHAQTGARPNPWISFSDDRDLMAASGAINGNAAAIIIDSGAQGIVLHSGGLERLGVTLSETQRSVRGLQGSASAGITGPFRLQLGPISTNVGRANAIDLSLLRRDHVDVDAIVGSPLFERNHAVLDFEAKRVAFGVTLNTPMPGAQELALTPSGGLRAVDASLAGGEPVKANFDLGAARPISVSAQFAASAGLLNGVRTSNSMGGGVEGYRQHTITTLRELRVGPMVFTNVPMSVLDDWLLPAPVNLGFPIFSSYNRFVTQYADNRALVVPGNGPRRPFSRDRAGLFMTRRDDTALVELVARGSPAERAGWRVGDVVIAINGGPTAGASRYLRGAGTGAVGSTVTYTMADGSTRSLTLADYF